MGRLLGISQGTTLFLSSPMLPLDLEYEAGHVCARPSGPQQRDLHHQVESHGTRHQQPKRQHHVSKVRGGQPGAPALFLSSAACHQVSSLAGRTAHKLRAEKLPEGADSGLKAFQTTQSGATPGRGQPWANDVVPGSSRDWLRQPPRMTNTQEPAGELRPSSV